MRDKQELVNVHRVLAEVRDHFEEEVGIQMNTDEYDSLDVTRVGIHQTSKEHEEAVKVLSREVVECLEEAEEENAPTA